MLAALETVDYVCLFDEETPAEIITAVRPDVLVKGADYRPDQVVGAEFVQSYGGRLHLAALAPGFSTTATLGSDQGRLTGTLMKIAVFLPNWVGDVVMATPTLRALAIAPSRSQNRRRAETGSRRSPLRQRERRRTPPLRPPGQPSRPSPWNVVKRIRQEQFDVGVLLTNSLRSAIAGVGRRSQTARRICARRPQPVSSRSARRRPNERGWTPSPVIDYYLRLAYHLGAAKTSYQMDLAVSPADETASPTTPGVAVASRRSTVSSR